MARRSLGELRHARVQLWDVASRPAYQVSSLTGHTTECTAQLSARMARRSLQAVMTRTRAAVGCGNHKPPDNRSRGHTTQCAAWRSARMARCSLRRATTPRVRLWDVAAGKSIGQPLTGHTDIGNSVAFSPDGKTLASASDDKTLRVVGCDGSNSPSVSRSPVRLGEGQPVEGRRKK